MKGGSARGVQLVGLRETGESPSILFPQVRRVIPALVGTSLPSLRGT